MSFRERRQQRAESPRRSTNTLVGNCVSAHSGSLIQTGGPYGDHEQVSVQRASLPELSALASWCQGDRVDALRSGILGAALDLHDDTAIKKVFDQVGTAGAPETAIARHLLARTLVLLARVGSATVGVLEMGPPAQLYQETMRQLEQSRADARTIITTHMHLTARISKLESVFVLPQLRHRGVASALVIEALRIAHTSAIKEVFGQFGASPPLARLCTRLGFTVKNEGATLRLLGGYQIQPQPTEQLFYTTVQTR